MRTIHLIRKFLVLPLLISLSSCSTLLNLPTKSENSTLGEVTPYTRELMELPPPMEKIVIGVYKFKDQTGQYKMAENGSSWSTAIPQGTTSILLKALEDSRWFRPIERENIGNLLNERQIIRSTRKEYKVEADGKTPIDDQLPPLLYAGILLEGGIISYDSNVMTGGIGARYFGIGGSTKYRQDRVTVYLRVVSSMTGEILKTVYTSKNILSTDVNGGFFRFIDTDRLLEAEMGVTQNEPVSIAVTEAIEKAVHSLIIEGVKDGLWMGDKKGNDALKELVNNYQAEKVTNVNKLIGNKFPNNYRSKFSIFGIVSMDEFKGDYVNAKTNIGVKSGLKYFITDNFNVEASAFYMKLENEGVFQDRLIGGETNLEFLVFPQYKLSPYVYGGVGALAIKTNPIKYKFQFGGGLEYIAVKNFGIRLNAQYDIGFTDNWDMKINGKRKDQAAKIGLGLNYYFGNAKN